MKLTRNFLLTLAALLFVFVLAPQSASAATANCPVEPVSNTPISDGEVFVGSNCVLNTTGDVDSFVFTGNSGDIWQPALGLNGTVSANICMTVYDPNFKVIYGPGCTGVGIGGGSAVAPILTLTLSGTYTIDVTENGNAKQEYAVSLERIHPIPPNAVSAKLATEYAGDISEPTVSNAFSFYGVTTGEYEVAASLSSSFSANICMTIYSSSGGLITPVSGPDGVCTGVDVGGSSTIAIDFTPTVNGTYLALVAADGYEGTQSYSFEVSCVVGKCQNAPPPPCTLKDVASYSASTSTLTMDFTVGNNEGTAGTWNVWLTYEPNAMTSVVSQALPVTVPAKAVTETASLPAKGAVGVFSTITTPTKGVVCNSYVQVATGTP